MPQNPQHALERQRIRAEIREHRRLLTPVQQQQSAHLAAQHIAEHPKIQQAHTVAVFLSFDGELDTQPIIEQLWQQKKQVYLPVLHPFSPGNLLFLRYRPESPLIRNRLKILEPQLDVREVLPLHQLDVVITPLVAFDRHGQRLGMGGGFMTELCNAGSKMALILLDWPMIASWSISYRVNIGMCRCQRL